MNTRNSAVEGRFYPSTKEGILDQIREIESKGKYQAPNLHPSRIFGAVLPHAGHIYSGHQTVPFFTLLLRLNMYPETFVIVHPNHTGYGISLAIDEAEVWTNSIGTVPVDREFALAMDLPFDRTAHAHEHSAEVIIPFLQYYLPDHPFAIVPVCMKDQGFQMACQVSERIAGAASQTGRNIMILASCDFSHFLPAETGREKDQHVIDEILSRNTRGVEEAVHRHQVSVCGYGPIMVLMSYAGSLDPGYRIEILARGNSGEVVSSREVVDYISLIIYQ